MHFYLRAFRYFRADWRLVLALVVLIWLALGLGALAPAAIAVLTDSVLTGKPPSNLLTRALLAAVPASKVAQILWVAFAWLLLQIANETVTLLREMINNQLRYNGTGRVRADLFDHLQRLSPAYHKARPQGDAIYRLGIDTQGFFGVLDTFIGAANSLLTIFFVALVMFRWNARITIAALCLTPLLLAANVWFGRTIRRTSLASKQADSDLTTFVQRAMSCIGLVQLFGRQPIESSRYRASVAHTISAGMKMSWQQQLYPWAQRVINAMGYAIVLGYGGYLVYRGQMTGAANAFTIGGMVAMSIYTGQLWEPLKRITGFSADVQNNAAACARVFAVMDLGPAVADAGAAIPLPVRPRTLELRDVCFAYGDGRPVLRGIDARIEPGEMVAFVGASGAGKSTLLHLLPRFYDPAPGSLLLDGSDLREIKLADVRRHIALVPQDSAVVAGTVAENIAFGHAAASPGRIRAAAELAGAASFIEALPEGYQTMVAEGGQNFSGGQRQRLAIARALLTEAPILVLDEPTSGLDRRQELLFIDTLKRLRGNRTIILVTHSSTAAAACDRILFLADGVIAEQGAHEELIAAGGPYAAMAAMPHLATNPDDLAAASAA